MLEEARARRRTRPSSRATRSPLPFEDGSFERVFTGHFYGHLEAPERERFLREARRAGARAGRRRLGAPRRTSTRRGMAGAHPQRRHPLAGLQALFRAGARSPRSSAAARRSSQDAGSSPSALDAAALALPLDRLAAARQPRLPRLRRGRLPARVAAGRAALRRPARVSCSARRRAWSRGRSGVPGAAAPAEPSAAGSSSRRTSSTRRSTAPRSRAATRARRRAAAATERRRRASRSSARSGATGSCG